MYKKFYIQEKLKKLDEIIVHEWGGVYSFRDCLDNDYEYGTKYDFGIKNDGKIVYYKNANYKKAKNFLAERMQQISFEEFYNFCSEKSRKIILFNLDIFAA